MRQTDGVRQLFQLGLSKNNELNSAGIYQQKLGDLLIRHAT